VRVDHKRSRRPSLLSLLALAGIGILVFLGVGFANGWLGLNNLFTTRSVDRSAPVILHRLNNLSSYEAASGTFSVVVDTEKDTFLPSWIAGSRAQYSGYGAVPASVDLGSLDAASVTQGSGGGLIVTLPHATLGGAQLNLKHSHVMNRDRGIADRLGGIFSDSPTSERALENAAIAKMNRAAKKSQLVERAERNTARMVKRLAAALGVENVTVRFGAPKPVAA
jgi:hypothetical protein